jgi:hypothetical protein
MDKRDKILERIVNLRNRADNDASSEAEAMTSLTMAAKLMDSYQVEEAELALAESEGRITIEVITEVSDTSCMNGRNRHRVMQTFWGVQNFTGTRIVTRTYTGEVDITGDKPDVEIANYLLSVIRKAMDKGYEDYKKQTVGVGRGAKAAFQQAMANRITSRLKDMKNASDAEREAASKSDEPILSIADEKIDSSTALVMIDIAKQKKDQIGTAMNSKYGNRLGTSKGFGRTSNGTAHGAGHKAGGRVNLGRAVNKSSNNLIGA